MSIKFGAKPVEFEKGKAGIVVGSKERLPTVIDTLIAAVRAGELDEIFSQARRPERSGSPGKPLDHQSGWGLAPPSPTKHRGHIFTRQIGLSTPSIRYCSIG
jgi:hypothetical protein